MKLKDLHKIEDARREANNQISFREYLKLSKEYGLNEIFDGCMRVAILNNRSRAEIPLRAIGQVEIRWMMGNGFTIKIENDKGVVQL